MQAGTNSGASSHALYSTQIYFLIVNILSFFVTFAKKMAVFNILRQNETIFDIENG